MKAQVSYLELPLKAMNLQGLHLIEASAGTGKTWTLSSLMVRILTEKYMPRQVIATTFTRAAAAELKSRIRVRLQEIQRLATQWSNLPYSDYATTQASLSDPLAQILFQRFQSLDNDQQNFIYLDNRLKLVLDSLDELFVGTIDSFTQKLLREFSFDSGEVIPRQLTEKEQQYPYQIVHDVLRAWLSQQPQEVVDLLLFGHTLKGIEDYVMTVSKTLNFSQATLKEVACPKLDFEQVKACVAVLLKVLQANGLNDLSSYYLLDGEHYPHINKSAFRNNKFHHLFADKVEKILQLIAENEKILVNPLFKKYLLELGSIFFDSKGEVRASIFGKKCPEAVSDFFYQHPLIKGLQQLVLQVEAQKAQLQAVDHYLRYYLSVEVKKRLPQTLLQAGETTFNQQTRTLREALVGEKGQQFAKAVLQRYPIILVDEFQDTNQEQDDILKLIWRDSQRIDQGCFIAVGDPKQAIYGFRGGDILTYINAFNDISAKKGRFYRLTHNFRSVANLVDVVDQLFKRNINFGENVDYYTAQSGNKDLHPLVHHQQADTQPLKLLQLADQQDEAYVIAHKIRELLVGGQNQQLGYLEKGEMIAILPEDIAILAASQRELDLVQKQLEKCNIQVNRAALNSVFASQEAQDIGAVLQAIVNPDQEAKLKRALLTPAIGLTLEDFQRFEEQADELSNHMHHFRHARQMWLSKGFLLAWQWLSEHYQMWKKLAEHQAAQAERTIVNTRHLLELLSQYSYQYQGIQHLLHWYQLQLSSPQQRDWELERKLSSASGVQLMTIHKSKGLEFKIVFLMHANKALDLNKIKPDELGFFEQGNAQQAERVITISPHLIKQDEQAYQKHQEKKSAENHRLWYVALTRASYAIYLVFKHSEKAGAAADFWLNATDQPAFEHAGFVKEEPQLKSVFYQPQALADLKLQAIAYPKQTFYPKTRTSFSYLASHQQHSSTLDALAEYQAVEEGAHDESNAILPVAIKNMVSDQPLLEIQKYFPKGAQPGTALHDLLESIDFQNSQRWKREIQFHLVRSNIWAALLANIEKKRLELQSVIAPQAEIHAQMAEQMEIWLESILHTPLHQVRGQSFCLKDLAVEHRLPEFDFYLSLADQRFKSEVIHQLFHEYDLNMPNFEAANTARYLNGAIDLVYFDGEKFHIADYKSSYLGDMLEHYAEDAIQHNMTSSSYWLQAGLYLVALHRHLKTSLKGYDPQQHLGGATYLYLRGMQGQVGYGVYHWQAPLSLILALDELLGQQALLQN